MKLAEMEPEVESEMDADPFATEPAESTEPVEPVESTEPAEVPPVQTLTDAERDHYERIKELNTAVGEATYKYEVANAKAKVAKKNLESLQTELSDLITDGPQRPSPQKELPFDQEQQPEADPEPEAEKFDWESAPLTDALKMTPKQQEKLDSIGIKTVGQFEFLRAGRDAMYPDGLRSIKGFGPATVDAFENDIVNWLAANAREKEPASDEQ